MNTPPKPLKPTPSFQEMRDRLKLIRRELDRAFVERIHWEVQHEREERRCKRLIELFGEPGGTRHEPQ